MKKLIIFSLILNLHFCGPKASNSQNKSAMALVPLALLGGSSINSEFDIPYATCEGAREFTKEARSISDETPANTIKYFKFISTKTETLDFSVNSAYGGSFCLFGFVPNQIVDNNSPIDTLVTSAEYCQTGFSLKTTIGDYRCIAVLGLSRGGNFNLTLNESSTVTSPTSPTPPTSIYDIKPDFNNPTLLTEGQTINETLVDYASNPSFKALDNYGAGKYFKFTIPANKTILVSLFNVSNTNYLDAGIYDSSGKLLTRLGLSVSTATNRSLAITADNFSEDVIIYIGGAYKDTTYSINVTVEGTIETKSFISSGLSTPSGIAVDNNGNIYIVDTNARKVFKFNSTGELQWSIGNGDGDVVGVNTVVKFKAPNGIAVDSSGNIYVTDTGAYKIKMIDPTGTNTSLVAGGIYGDNGVESDVPGISAKFANLRGIAVDNTFIYVADNSRHTIRKIRKSNNTVSVIAGSGTGVIGRNDGIGTNARFWYPLALTISNGNLFVTEDKSVRKINLTTSEVTTITSTSSSYYLYSDGDTSTIQITSMRGIVGDNAGNLYVTAYSAVYKLVPNGKTFSFSGGSGGTGDLLGFGTVSKFQFIGDSGIVFDSSGNLLVADTGNSKIKKIIHTP